MSTKLLTLGCTLRQMTYLTSLVVRHVMASRALSKTRAESVWRSGARPSSMKATPVRASLATSTAGQVVRLPSKSSVSEPRPVRECDSVTLSVF